MLVVSAIGVSCFAGCTQTGDTSIKYDLIETNEKINYTFFSPGFEDLAENDSVVKYIEDKFNVDITFANRWTNRRQR